MEPEDRNNPDELFVMEGKRMRKVVSRRGWISRIEFWFHDVKRTTETTSLCEFTVTVPVSWVSLVQRLQWMEKLLM